MDGETTLAETAFPWEFDRWYALSVEVSGTRIQGWIDGEQLFNATDDGDPLTGGGVGLVITEGCMGSEAVRVRPVGG